MRSIKGVDVQFSPPGALKFYASCYLPLSERFHPQDKGSHSFPKVNKDICPKECVHKEKPLPLKPLHYTCQASHTVPSFKEKLIRKVPSPAFPFWLFSSLSVHSFADGGSLCRFIQNLITIEEGSARGSALDVHGVMRLGLEECIFPIPFTHGQLKQYPIQTLLHCSLTGEDLNYLSFICKHILLCTGHTEGIK